MLGIDINVDAGESQSEQDWLREQQVMKLASSVNIACGGHAGSAYTMHRTVKFAVEHQLSIGAHPGFADRSGFGRRMIACSAEEIHLLLIEQIAALAAFAKIEGVAISHVKPHGALYHMANVDREVASAVVKAVADFDDTLKIYTPFGSELHRAATQKGLRTVCEAFADRVYESNGELRARSHADAVIVDSQRASKQVMELIFRQRVQSIEGQWIAMRAATVCIHGDHPHSVALLQQIRKELAAQNVIVRAPH